MAWIFYFFFPQALDTQIGEFWAGISCQSESVGRQGQRQRETRAMLGEGQGSGVPSAFLPLLVISPFPYPWLCEGKSRSFNFPKSSVTYSIHQKPSPHMPQAAFSGISNAHSPWHSLLRALLCAQARSSRTGRKHWWTATVIQGCRACPILKCRCFLISNLQRDTAVPTKGGRSPASGRPQEVALSSFVSYLAQSPGFFPPVMS